MTDNRRSADDGRDPRAHGEAGRSEASETRAGSEATRECGAEADADAGPLAAVLGATLGPLGATVGAAVDERRFAVGLSLGLGTTDDTTVSDADEATTIEIEGTDGS